MDWCWSWNSQSCGHLMWRIDSLEKTLMLGKMEGRRRRGRQRMRCLDGITDAITNSCWWTWVWASSRSWWWTGKHGGSPWGHKELYTTEWLNWTELNSKVGLDSITDSMDMNLSKLPRDSGRQRSLVSLVCPWGCKEWNNLATQKQQISKYKIFKAALKRHYRSRNK